MAPSIEAPQQYRQTSRKGKKAWRKNVDVSDVQTGLEIVREEIINGSVGHPWTDDRSPWGLLTLDPSYSGVIAEKPSGELFTVDTGGSEQIQRSYNKVHRPLKADQILAQRSVVTPVDNRKRPYITDGVIEPSSKRRRGNGVSHKELERLRAIAYGGESVPKDIVRADGAPNYDPWAINRDEYLQDPKINYIDKRKPTRAPKTLKEASISLVQGMASFPAIPKPNAGKSYNPKFEDWDKLLVEEGEREIEAERKRLREAEEEQMRLDRIALTQAEREDIQTEDESAWEGFESEYDGEEWLKKRRLERKTPTERNKVKRRKEAERQAKWEAQMKKRSQQAQRIQEIAREVNAKGDVEAITLAQAEGAPTEADEGAPLRRRKLGKSR